MIRNVTRLVVAVAVCAFVGGGPSRASAQVADHLKCYKVKDLRAQTNIHFTLTLTPTMPPFTVETGCQVQSAARNVCIPVVKSSVSPPPFPAPAGAPAQVYTCYNMRCPREQNVNFNIQDQIGGSGSLLVKRRSGKRQLCVPTAPAATTTTTVVTTTTSTTVPSASPSFVFDSDMYFGSGLL